MAGVNIIVNCNSDTITIEAKGKDTVQLPCKDPSKTIEILFDIFEMMDWNGNDIVGLHKIDEDTETTVGEWSD